MSDLYLKLVNTPVGKTAAQSLGLPSPAPLTESARVFMLMTVVVEKPAACSYGQAGTTELHRIP